MNHAMTGFPDDAYDFDTVIDRRGHGDLAVEALGAQPGTFPNPPHDRRLATAGGLDGIIPMWVADMGFATFPGVRAAIARRLDYPLFGYFQPTSDYYDAIIRWHHDRHGVVGMRADHIGYENGVLGGIVSAMAVFASPGDPVLVHAPTYPGFTDCLTANGYRIVRSPLVRDQAGVWRMDYDDMDRALRREQIHIAILCSPHNPTGRVWEREELERAMAVYRSNRCVVLCDEIWSDLVLDGYRHLPAQSINDDARKRTIAFYAPSKTFNLAGLTGAYHVVYNEYLRERLRTYERRVRYNEMNVLSMHAVIGAYGEGGGAWVDRLRGVLTRNVRYARNHILERFAPVRVGEVQGTYMLYLDCAQWCRERRVPLDELIGAGWDAGVMWQDGRQFERRDAIRMNVALPMPLLEEAMRRLDGVFGRWDG